MDFKWFRRVFLLITICAILLEGTNGQLTGQIFPPGQTCPDIACTLEFIPEECREVPTFLINGINCTGCPRRKAVCDRSSNTATATNCPALACPELAVSKECQFIEPYEYNGRKCSSCPKVRPECAGAGSKLPKVVCPPQACPLIFIPEECREIPTTDFMGQKCEGCPKWRDGCIPNQNNAFQPIKPRPVFTQASMCPTIACDSYVPKECQVQNEFQYKGRVCQSCPSWREGCREAERRALMSNPSIGRTFPTAPVKCPVFPCAAVQIPAQCLQQQPFEYNGKTCYRCPRMREGCAQVAPNGFQGITPNVPCPLIRCQTLSVPAYCLEQQTYQFNGRLCNKCPTVKSECRVLASQAPMIVDLAPQPLTSPCPSRRCPLINIPKECIEIETFQFDGKTCEGCPRFRPECVPDPNNEGGVSIIVKTNGNSVTEPTKVVVECPVVGCPKIYIAPECRVEQPYQLQGKTCYGCPKKRENCTANAFITINNSTRTDMPDAECPLLACNRMYIPPECRETQSYEFMGRTCYTCPKFRVGCVPVEGTSGVSTNILANITSAEPVVKPLDIAPTAPPEVACPLIRCQNLNLPPECFVEQKFLFMGKSCPSCPVVAPQCANNQVRGVINTDKRCPVPICSDEYIPSECLEIQTHNVNGVTCPKCPRRRDGCKLREIGIALPNPNGQVPRVSCPLVACADNIPIDCIEPQPYLFQGQTCYECPKMREGCSPKVSNGLTGKLNSGIPAAPGQNQGPNIECPVFDCQQQYEVIPKECQEEIIYMHQGVKKCPRCPRWRQGCVPKEKPQNQDAPKPNAPRITDLRGIIPVERLMSAVQASLCPRLPCPEMNIPPQCREQSRYMFRRVSCPGCPTWKRSCKIGRPGQPNLNMNGILAASLYNEMMTR